MNGKNPCLARRRKGNNLEKGWPVKNFQGNVGAGTQGGQNSEG